MLRKLIKYEFKATGRIFFPLYLALIIIAFIQRLFFQFNIENMGSIVINILFDCSVSFRSNSNGNMRSYICNDHTEVL